jgi:hypothetical protein
MGVAGVARLLARTLASPATRQIIMDRALDNSQISGREKKPGFLRQFRLKSLRFPKNQPSEAGLLALGIYS